MEKIKKKDYETIKYAYNDFLWGGYFSYICYSNLIRHIEFDQCEEIEDIECNNILIYQGKEIVPIRKTEILHIFAEENYRYIRTSSSIHMTNYSLEKLEEIVGENFFRLNRQNIVAFQAIDKILHEDEQRISIVLRAPICKTIQISKRKNNSFKQWLKHV